MISVRKQVQQLGFTLIELMVVIAIIGLLMAAGLVSYTSAQKNARDAKRQADINAVGQAMEMYASTNNSTYPVYANYAALALGTAYLPGGNPVDPKNSGVNVYTLVSAATGFCTCGGLENLGKGNSTASATAATCTFAVPGPAVQGYYCVQNQQ